MADRASVGRALLTALAGLTAYEGESLAAGDLLDLSGDDPGEAFTAALSVAAALAREVRRLGGDPDEVLARVYRKADALAYS